jgi:hypothetical protein
MEIEKEIGTMSMGRRGQRKKLSIEAGDLEVTENLAGVGMVASEKMMASERMVTPERMMASEKMVSPERMALEEKVVASEKEVEAASGGSGNRVGEVAVDEKLQQFRDVWPHLGVGAVSTDLYDRFQRFKKELEGTLWKQFGHSPIGLSDHDFFIEILRTVEWERAEQKENARKNLEKAQMATRCAHVHLDGARCGCPKMKNGELCYIHDKLEKAKSAKLDLGPMDDPDSIQVGIAKLQTAVIDGLLEPMQVRQLAYLIQLAAWNVKQTTLMSQRWDVGDGLGAGRSKSSATR